MSMGRASDLRRALRLSGLSVALSAAVGSVAVYAAVTSGSLSILGFGVDAVIDSIASIGLIWRFHVESRDPERAETVERAAERIVAGALLALAAYLAFGAARALGEGGHPSISSASVGLLVGSVLVLPPVAVAKYRVAKRLASGALRADSVLTAVAASLAAISLLSAVAATALGWWWADAVAAIGIGAILVREGSSSLRLARRDAARRRDDQAR
jgi:divalent metal cation (Fe/Co/Zn/Cd) transporter